MCDPNQQVLQFICHYFMIDRIPKLFVVMIWMWYRYCCFLAELSPEESEDVLFKEVWNFSLSYLSLHLIDFETCLFVYMYVVNCPSSVVYTKLYVHLKCWTSLLTDVILSKLCGWNFQLNNMVSSLLIRNIPVC